MDQDKQEKSVSIESNQNSKQDEQQDSESSKQDKEYDSEDLQSDESYDSKNSNSDQLNNTQRIVLNVKNLNNDNIKKYTSKFVKKSYIYELTIDFTYLEEQENDIKFQMKKIVEIITKVKEIEIMIIKFYFSEDFFDQLGFFFKQMNKKISFDQKLSLIFKQGNKFLKFNNLDLFGQIIGKNRKISKLNLDLSSVKIKSDEVLSIIHGIAIENMSLKQLEINLKENNFEVSKLQDLIEIISNIKALKDFKLELDIQDIKDEERQLINTLVSYNLQQFTFNLSIYQCEKKENIDIDQQQCKSLFIKLGCISINDINNLCIDTQIINQSKNLMSLDINLANCTSNSFINYIQSIFQIQNLMILNITLDLYLIELSYFEQLENHISNCIKLSLDLTNREKQSEQEITKLSKILACTKNLQFLKIDLQYFLNKEQMNELLLGVNKCQQLRNLTIKAIDINSQIDHKQFNKLIANNKFLNSLTFAFIKIPRHLEEEEEGSEGFTSKSQFERSKAIWQRNKEKKKQLAKRDNVLMILNRNMTNGQVFKKNLRFIKFEFLLI